MFLAEILKSRGSEWRKWDLHLHSLYSNLENSYAGVSADEFIKKIRDSNLEVIGLTNYFLFSDNDFDLKLKLEKKGIKVFLNLELRLTYQNKEDNCCDLHIVFDNNLEREKIEKFLSNLTVHIDGDEKKASELIGGDFRKGVVEFDDLISTLNEKSLGIKGRYLIGFLSRGKGNSRSSSVYAKIAENANFLIHSSTSEENLEEDRTFWLSNEKPLIQSSDAHKLSDIGSKFTWIKADTTFPGFKQILNEPDDRVCIEATPTKLLEVNNNKSRHIDSIKINNINQDVSPSWFDDRLPLNSGLVAVIGRKGSGKSALADIISLCGDSKINPADYSFLKSQKFKKRGLAKNYEANLVWLDAQESNKNLDDEVQDSTPERVKYLPQQYVENICNEDGVSTLFQQEIDKVIFSYVPDENRLNTQTLAELIKTKTSSVDDSILAFRNELHKLNEEIVLLEGKELPQYMESLIKKLEVKNQELKNIPKPKAVKKPKTILSKVQIKKVEKLTGSIEKISSQIEKASEELKATNNKLHKLEQITTKVALLQQNITSLLDTFKESASELSIDLTEVINLKVSNNILEEKKTELVAQKLQLDAELEKNNPKSSTSLYNQKVALEAELAKVAGVLNADQKLYKEYLQAVRKYDEAKQIIIGKESDTSADTINGIEAEIDFVNNKLSHSLEDYNKKRNSLLKKTFDELEKKITFYQEIYAPLVQFIENEKDTQKKSGSVLSFSAGLTFGKQKFATDFFSFINQSRDGSFQGVAEGQKILNGLIEKYDFAKKNDVEKLISDILDHLKNDNTKKTTKSNNIISQLKKDQIAFYDFLFSLDFLDVKYKILFNGKDLNANEFSPGEKGALLLIFYLLIDKENIPLVIDQPEENLDNESVYTLLVPYIKKAKIRRQIIAVTHNPNLAVVCDAEQVVCASMDKRKNEIRYTTGSIEDPVINKKIVDILEGTLPAFTIRDRKYIKLKKYENS